MNMVTDGWSCPLRSALGSRWPCPARRRTSSHRRRPWRRTASWGLIPACPGRGEVPRRADRHVRAGPDRSGPAPEPAGMSARRMCRKSCQRIFAIMTW